MASVRVTTWRDTLLGVRFISALRRGRHVRGTRAMTHVQPVSWDASCTIRAVSVGIRCGLRRFVRPASSALPVLPSLDFPFPIREPVLIPLLQAHLDIMRP